MTSTEKKPNCAVEKRTDKNIKRKPNKMSIGIRPFNPVEMTKSEMYAGLKKAVENTK